MATATISPITVVDAAPAVSEAYASMEAAIKAYVLDNQARPTFKGAGLTKDEKADLIRFQRELVKGLSDTDKAAFKVREAQIKANAKAEREKEGPRPMRVDAAALKESSEILNALVEAAANRKGVITLNGQLVKAPEALQLVAKRVAEMVANPVKSSKPQSADEAVPHTVIRFAKAGGDPFVYGKYDDKKAADKAAKLFVKRLQAVGPGVAEGFEFKVLPVEAAQAEGYTVPDKAA